MRRRAFLVSAASLAVGGCANWNSTPTPEVSLRPLVEHSASVQHPRLIVSFLPLEGSPEHVAAIRQLWNAVDVGPIDSETRQRWRDNGCRIGVSQDADSVKRLMSKIPRSDDPHQRLVATADIRDDSSGTRQSTPMINGKPHEIVAGQPMVGSQTLLCNFDGRLVARTLEAAQPMLEAQLITMIGRQGVRLRITPKIQFGQSQRKFVSSEAAIRIDSDRPVWSLDPLTINWDAAAGETLLIGPEGMEPPTGLAADIFAPAERPMIIALTAEVPS